MKKLLLILFAGLLFAPTVNAQEKLVLEAKPKDYKVVSNNPDVDLSRLSVANRTDVGNYIKRIYFKIHKEDLNNERLLSEAKLNLKIGDCVGEQSRLTIGTVTSDWDDKINWENKPGFSTPVSTILLDCNNITATWDVTELIKSLYLEGKQNYGFVIFGEEDKTTQSYEKFFDFDSEGTVLNLIYSDEPLPAENVPYSIPREFLVVSLIILIVLLVIMIGMLVRTILSKTKRKKSETKTEEPATVQSNPIEVIKEIVEDIKPPRLLESQNSEDDKSDASK